MKYLLSAMLIAALVLATAQASEVYRTVDERGVVVYSDRPLGPHSERVTLHSGPTGSARAADESDPLPAQQDRRGARADEEALADARAEQAAMREQACRDARQTAETYEISPRIYEELPDGGRRYLTDDEVVEARLEARRAVALFCD